MPYKAKPEDIEKFLNGIEVVENGVIILLDGRRASGECIILLKRRSDTIKSLCKNNGKMGERYIDVFLSNYKEFLSLKDNNFVVKPYYK